VRGGEKILNSGTSHWRIGIGYCSFHQGVKGLWGRITLQPVTKGSIPIVFCTTDRTVLVRRNATLSRFGDKGRELHLVEILGIQTFFCPDGGVAESIH
jgi:hypothetical protein